jgi:hypothetical protein
VLRSPAFFPCSPWRLAAWVIAALLFALHAPLRAEPLELESFELVRGDDGLLLSFSAQFELPRVVEDALLKGVPIYFVADAEVYRSRWYWRDKQVAAATRTWRLAFQPLTRKYRVTFGGLHQSYDNLFDALASLRRVVNWRLAEPAQIEEDAQHYVEFSYRLDTSQLPRPMQIGIGGQADWTLKVERAKRF